MEINSWSNFVRTLSGSSAQKLIDTLLEEEIIVIKDNKFCGEKVIVIRESRLRKIQLDGDVKLSDLYDRHLNIVEKLLDLSKTNETN